MARISCTCPLLCIQAVAPGVLADEMTVDGCEVRTKLPVLLRLAGAGLTLAEDVARKGVTRRWAPVTPTPLIWVAVTLARGKYVACVTGRVTVIDAFDTLRAGAAGMAVICVRPVAVTFSSCLIMGITTRTCVEGPADAKVRIEAAVVA